MNNDFTKPIVYLICGQIGSGKTTFAKKLEKETDSIRFTPDEWMLKLYQDMPEKEDFDSYYYRCCDIAWSVAVKIIRLGGNIVLDFGFWKYSDRKNYIDMISKEGGIPKLYYIQCNKNKILTRLQHRNNSNTEGAVYIDEEMFEFYSPGFEQPCEPEVYTVIKND